MYLKRIGDLREDNDLKQKDLAKVLNISQQYYSNIEKGQRTITAEMIKYLSIFYNVSSDYILELTDNKKINK